MQSLLKLKIFYPFLSILIPFLHSQYYSQYYSIPQQMLHHQIPTKQSTQFTKQQQNTSQTLTSFSASSTPMLPSTYTNIFSSQYQLLEHTLSHGNLQALQTLLQSVTTAANMRIQIEEKKVYGSFFTKYLQNLEQVSDTVMISSTKIQQCRKILQQKLKKYLLHKSKTTNIKNTIKSNIYKYKQALFSLKNIKNNIQNNIKTQRQLNKCKNKIKNTKILILPRLILTKLVNLVGQALYNNKNSVKIQDKTNLKYVVGVFMNKSYVSQYLKTHKIPTTNTIIHNNDQQLLYFKFWQYIFLKKFIKTPPPKQISHQQITPNQPQTNSSTLDTCCQTNIINYIQQYPSTITKTQLNKIYSLVQCDILVNSFLSKQLKSYLRNLLIKINIFVKSSQETAEDINKNLVQKILNKNKKIQNYQQVEIPIQCNSYIQPNSKNNYPSQQIINTDSLSQLLHQIQKNQILMNTVSQKQKLQFKQNQLKYLIINYSLKCLIQPLLKLTLGIAKNISNSEQEKNYHTVRMTGMIIFMGQNILGVESAERNNKIIKIIQQYIKLWGSPQKNDPEEKTPKNQKQKSTLKYPQKHKQGRKNYLTLAQFITKYNQRYGQIYLYLSNKLTNIKNTCHLTSSTLKHQSNKPILQIQQLINLWSHLISQHIVQYQLQQVNPINILKQIGFFQTHIINMIEQKHKIQNDFNGIQTMLNKIMMEVKDKEKTNKKQISLKEEDKQKIYSQLSKLSLRTRNYDKLIFIAKAIKAQNSIKLFHTQMYRKFCQKLNIQ